MATGPDHYREAERLIKVAEDSYSCEHGDRVQALNRAQIHATLAMAAATAMAGAPGGMNPIDLEEWDGVCGAQETDEDEPCARCGDYGHEAADCEAILDDGSIDAGEEWRLAEREHGNWLAAEPNDEQAEPPAATCIRCTKPFAENDDYHQVAMSGPNSLLFIHSEDCEAAL